MGVFDDWFKTVKEVILRPREFFKKMPVSGGYGEPLKFALVNLFLGAILSFSGFITTRGKTQEFSLFKQAIENYGFDILDLSMIWIVGVFILGGIGLFITAALYHIILKILGSKKKYEATFRIVTFISAFSLISWIPMAGILISLYSLYVLAIAFKEVHKITSNRAVLSIALVLIAAFLIAFIMIVVFSLIASNLGAVTQPI